jgi:hypothetical protein
MRAHTLLRTFTFFIDHGGVAARSFHCISYGIFTAVRDQLNLHMTVSTSRVSVHS